MVRAGRSIRSRLDTHGEPDGLPFRMVRKAPGRPSRVWAGEEQLHFYEQIRYNYA